MAKQFNVGDTVYFVSSSVFVRKAIVIRAAAGFVTIKFDTNNGCLLYTSPSPRD